MIHDNPLDRKTQQLVHFAMRVALARTEPARLHVCGVLKAGAGASELYGVCATAAIVGGLPAHTLAVDLVYEALAEIGAVPATVGP